VTFDRCPHCRAFVIHGTPCCALCYADLRDAPAPTGTGAELPRTAPTSLERRLATCFQVLTGEWHVPGWLQGCPTASPDRAPAPPLSPLRRPRRLSSLTHSAGPAQPWPWPTHSHALGPAWHRHRPFLRLHRPGIGHGAAPTVACVVVPRAPRVESLCRRGGPGSGVDEDLERPPVGHGPVPVGYFVEADGAVEHPTRVDRAVEHVGQ
jgi:hypothetical protein